MFIFFCATNWHRGKYALASLLTSDVNLKFLENFEVCGNLIYCRSAKGRQKLPIFQKISRVDVFYVTYIAHRLTIIHANTFHGSMTIFAYLVLKNAI